MLIIFLVPFSVPSFNKGTSSAPLILLLLTPSDSGSPLTTVSSVFPEQQPHFSAWSTHTRVFVLLSNLYLVPLFPLENALFFSFNGKLLQKLWLTANFLLPCHSSASPKFVFCSSTLVKLLSKVTNVPLQLKDFLVFHASLWFDTAGFKRLVKITPRLAVFHQMVGVTQKS